MSTGGAHPRRFKRSGDRPAVARQPPGVMNKSEDLYARTVLDVRLRIGEIVYWGFEVIKFRLGSGAWYTPDFMVVTDRGLIEIHEYKGHWEIAARVRIKAAAAGFPWFSFRAIQRVRGEYKFETIKSHHSYTSETLAYEQRGDEEDGGR